MLTMTLWYAAAQTDNLEPSDDVWGELIKRYGDTTARFLTVYAVEKDASGKPAWKPRQTSQVQAGNGE